MDQYLRTFSWNKVKYRADKPLAELIDMLQKVCASSTYTVLKIARGGRRVGKREKQLLTMVNRNP